jgi:hypothetical protein
MSVGAIARIDHWDANVLCHQMGSPGVFMPEDERSGSQRPQCPRRVEQCFTLLDAASAGGDVDNVSPEVFRSDLEGDSRAGARLIEQIHDTPAAQRRHPRDGSSEDLFHAVGGFENTLDLIAREVI